MISLFRVYSHENSSFLWAQIIKPQKSLVLLGGGGVRVFSMSMVEVPEDAQNLVKKGTVTMSRHIQSHTWTPGLLKLSYFMTLYLPCSFIETWHSEPITYISACYKCIHKELSTTSSNLLLFNYNKTTLSYFLKAKNKYFELIRGLYALFFLPFIVFPWCSLITFMCFYFKYCAFKTEICRCPLFRLVVLCCSISLPGWNMPYDFRMNG